MSMAFNALGRILLVSSECTVELSVWMGVCGCGWPNSSNMRPIDIAVFGFMNSTPSSASAANDITVLIICKMFNTAPLLMGISSVLAINMWLLAWLQALGLDKYDALLWMESFILLAR